MTAALVVSLGAQAWLGLSAEDPAGFARLLMLTTALTTVAWVGVTLATPAEPAERLRAFYRRARPGGPGWRAVAPEASSDARLGAGLLQWVAGCAVVYLALFGIGGLLLGRPVAGVVALIAAGALVRYLVRATADVAAPVAWTPERPAKP